MKNRRFPHFFSTFAPPLRGIPIVNGLSSDICIQPDYKIIVMPEYIVWCISGELMPRFSTINCCYLS